MRMVASIEVGNSGLCERCFSVFLQNFAGAGTLLESIWKSLRELGDWAQRELQWSWIILLLSDCMCVSWLNRTALFIRPYVSGVFGAFVNRRRLTHA